MSKEPVKQTQLDRDKAALANPESADQVMEIAKRSAALHKALKGMRGYEEEYYKAFEVMIGAYRIVGTELRQMEKATGAMGIGTSAVPEGNHTPTLSDLGITKKQSSEWQSIALVPRTDIEEYIKARKEESETVTKAAILEIARNYKTADEVCLEEIGKVLPALSSFLIHSNRLILHLRKFPESRKVVPKEFFEQLTILERIYNELNQTTM